MRLMHRLFAALLLATVLGVMAEPAQPARYDVLIRNARVMDGTGNPWLRADLGITGDRITAVGRLSGATAARVIDARDRIVAPGFIDVHSHAGEGLTTAALHQGQPPIAQGITTVIANPDGGDRWIWRRSALPSKRRERVRTSASSSATARSGAP